MAALAVTHPTLLDFAKTLDPDHKVAQIVEILNETNEVIEDFVSIEGNLPTGHRTTIRSGLPTPTWRKLYGGVQPSKARNLQVTDNTGMLEAYAEVDKALADLNGNTAAFRMSEDRAHIEGMSQEFVQTLFYGNEGSEPEAFTGLSARFNSTTAENGGQVILSSGASADNSSIWLIVWGTSTVHGIYPKASQGGLQMTDKGQVTIENVDGAGGRMEAYRSHYRMDGGLSVRDWRYVVRVANIPQSVLASGTAAKALIDLMIRAAELPPSLSAGKAAFYGSRQVRTALRLGINDKVSNQLTFDTVTGKRVLAFDGIPFRRVDQLIATEALVA